MTAAAAITSAAGLLGVAFGYILGRMHHKAMKANAGPPAPICMCDHNFGDHVEGGRCKADIRDSYRRRIGGCACQVYVGPDPVLSGHWTPSK